MWPPVSTDSLHILLVEDDDGDAMAVERTLRKARIAKSIVRAVDGVEALEILKGTGSHPRLQKPYLLLVDLNLPRMSGIQLVTAKTRNCTMRSSSS